MKIPKLKYIDRVMVKGRVYDYYKRDGRRHGRVEGEPNTVEYLLEYERIHKTFERGSPGVKSGTVAAVISEYKNSADFTELSKKSQTDYSHHLDHINRKWGDLKITSIKKGIVKAYRDSLKEKPATANYRMAVLRRLMSFAEDMEYILINPARKPKRMQVGTWEAWTEDQIELMKTTKKKGLKTALYLALYTGQRQADDLAMTWAREKENRIQVKQQKTGTYLSIPIHSALKEYLSTLDKKCITMICRDDNIPYKQNHFKHDWKAEMDRLGIIGVVFHGLRKNATNSLLEAGCTEHEVSSITGMSPQMVRHYAKRVNQSKLADSAMEKLENQT